MIEIKVLILDDDEEAQKGYDGVITRFNRDSSDYHFKVFTATTLAQAEEHINYTRLDAAILDLNLGGSSEDDDGNLAIKDLIENFRIPISIVSGELSKLKEEYSANPLVVAYERGGDVDTRGILNEIIEKLSSETVRYFSRNGYLEEMINEFYWNHLSKTATSWKKIAEENPNEIDKVLSRHTMSCLNEILYVNGNRGSFDLYHSGEFYIMPPIKNHYHTGDVIQNEENKFILLNPACDIVNVNKGKLHHYLLARLIKMDELSDIEPKIQVGQEGETLFNSLNQSGQDLFNNYKKNLKGERFHYLPSFHDIETDYLIDFQDITSIAVQGNNKVLDEREGVMEPYKRIASVSSPFLKDIVVRFSSYYSRQGQPNLM